MISRIHNDRLVLKRRESAGRFGRVSLKALFVVNSLPRPSCYGEEDAGE